jgi:rhodanese-related sulfurtransferase
MKIFIMIGLLWGILQANNDLNMLQYLGVTTVYNDKKIQIIREKDKKCAQVGVTVESVLGGDLAGRNIPKECTKTFITTLGVVQPIKIDKEIETVGELEVLNFIQLLDFEPESYLLLDARSNKWYKEMTIPHAVNIPKATIAYDDFNHDYDKNLKLLNIKKDKNGNLSFKEAKEVIVFCNSAWCTQSAKAIKELIKLGYPKKRLKWYRGGLQDWVALGFTVEDKRKK